MRSWAKRVGTWLGLGVALLLVLPGGTAMAVDFAKAIPDEYRVNGFAIGCQAYTFNRYSFFEAVDKTKETGCKLIEAYPGQRLSPDDDTKFNHDASPEVWEKARKKLDSAGVKLVAYGVVGLGKDEAANRKVFDFAKKMGILVITSEPPADAIDGIAKLAKEYGIPVAIHNHPKRPDDASYRHWDPDFVLECAAGHEGIIGACADTGHWMRSDVKPVQALRKLKGNIVSMHIKDLNKFGRGGEHDVPFGTGKVNMNAVLMALKRQKYNGIMSIEYEHNWTKSVPEIKECVQYLKEWKPQPRKKKAGDAKAAAKKGGRKKAAGK